MNRQQAPPRRQGSTTLKPPREPRSRTLGRRLGAIGRFGVKHRGSLTCVFGAVLAATSLVAFEGTVQLLALLFSGVAIVGGAALHHHQRTRITTRSPNVARPSWSQRAAFEQEMRKPGQPGGSRGGPVHVGGHSRGGEQVGGYTRARPGEGGAT